ncbi:hypothetical protein [Salegentibacter chungangensis]|uniref:Membrane or secreted protein n=1 Tax=Salegentibacter chungangensis TaxID=1335724 RepID=A0ABW3NMC2_9FLAO
MKKIILLSALIFSFSLYAQNIEGSWRLISENGKEITDAEVIRIYEANYFAESAKKPENNEFLWARGGEFSLNDYKEKTDFNTKEPETVGKDLSPKLAFPEKGKLKISYANKDQVWERISSEDNDLTGNWVITGRKRNGKIDMMTPGDRRTVKILGGGRFQWIAFNSATKEFFGSGGGTYSANNGKYIENIEVFSRDKSRAGASLDFDYEIRDGNWHHSGKSSKGDPIYEIWSPYKKAYKK